MNTEIPGSSEGLPAKGATGAELLAEQIAEAIMLGEYPLGSPLRQEQLAHRFGVSRQPIREALHRLEMVGMIEAIPRRGMRVRGPHPSDIRDGYLIRAALEALAARLAAERMDQSRLTELRAVYESYRDSIVAEFERPQADVRPTWIRDHNRFHELIHEATGIERLARQIRALNLSLPRNLTLDAVQSKESLTENIRQHEAILIALEMQAPQLAADAMETHIVRSGVLITDWLVAQHETAGLSAR